MHYWAEHLQRRELARRETLLLHDKAQITATQTVLDIFAKPAIPLCSRSSLRYQKNVPSHLPVAKMLMSEDFDDLVLPDPTGRWPQCKSRFSHITTIMLSFALWLDKRPPPASDDPLERLRRGQLGGSEQSYRYFGTSEEEKNFLMK